MEETWGEAEFIIHHAINESIRDEYRGITDPSMTKRIVNALLAAGFLKKEEKDVGIPSSNS